jgi:hypothetical protein
MSVPIWDVVVSEPMGLVKIDTVVRTLHLIIVYAVLSGGILPPTNSKEMGTLLTLLHAIQSVMVVHR